MCAAARGTVPRGDLRLDVGEVIAGGDHVRDVGATEGVWGDVGADRGPVLRRSDLVLKAEIRGLLGEAQAPPIAGSPNGRATLIEPITPE